MKAQKAEVPLRKLWLDWVLVIVSLLGMLTGFIIDWRSGHSDWFPRSGAWAVVSALFLAYRSLARHYRKFYNNQVRGFPLLTSDRQTLIDRETFLLSIAGTLVWGFGDKIL